MRMSQRMIRDVVECQLLKLGEHYGIVQLPLHAPNSSSVTGCRTCSFAVQQRLVWTWGKECSECCIFVNFLAQYGLEPFFCVLFLFLFFGLLHVSLMFYRELSYLTKNADMEVDCLPLEPAWTFSYFIGFVFPILPSLP